MTLNEKKAIIFDFDNTLVDEAYWIKQRWAKVLRFAENELKLKGLEAAFWQVYQSHGPAYKYHVNRALEAIGAKQTLTPQIVGKFLGESCDERLLEGARDCLDGLHSQGKTLAVITNGLRQSHEARITRAGLAKYFDVVVYAEKNPKPSQEPYRECLQKLKRRPEEAVYVGDSPEIDLKTAAHLGIATIWLRSNTKLTSPYADFSVLALRDIVNIVRGTV